MEASRRLITSSFTKGFLFHSRILRSDNSVLGHRRFMSVVAQKLMYNEYGDPEKVISVEQETLQQPGPNEVVVRMLAAPVNPADINTIQGVYAVKPPLPSIPGNEGVGLVEQVGPNVKTLKKGDWVLPNTSAWGTWRTHALCKADELLKIPNDIDVIHAATVAVNPCTAYRMLRDFAKLSEEDTVIQNGANSAVGQSVIQMCKAWGISTVNIVRNRGNLDELRDYLSKLGATHVLTEDDVRTTELFTKGGVRKPILALNCVGGKNALNMMRHLAHRGVMVTYGGMSREPVTVPTSALIFKDISIVGYWMTQWTKIHQNNPLRQEMMDDIFAMIRKGHLKPPVHEMVPFSKFNVAIKNALNAKGFAGRKFILDFQSS